MLITKCYFELDDPFIDGNKILQKIERAGRTCYKSEDKITDESAAAFVRTIIASGHHSVLEHAVITVRVICDRGMSHEIVRHRIAAYSQESTRYCNYSKSKHGGAITVISPEAFMSSEQLGEWQRAMDAAERHYFKLLEMGAKPQMARSVLPNSLKTEIVITYNLREWRLFFQQRTAEEAQPQLRALAREMLTCFRGWVPVVFDDVGVIP